MAVRRKRNSTPRFKNDMFGRTPLTMPTVSAEAGTTDMWGTLVSSMQSNIQVSNKKKITGTLSYLTSGQLVTDWGEGYFIALKLSDIDEDFTDVKIGLVPSAGSGILSIDPDANCVCHLTDISKQQFTVWVTDGYTSQTDYYDLSGLTLTPKAE